MMKTLITCISLVVALCVANSRADAQYQQGALGIGVESPLGMGPLLSSGGVTAQLPGLSLRLQLSETFGLQLILAYRVGNAKNIGPDTKTSLLGTFLRAHFAMVQHEIVALGVFGGFGFTNAKLNGPGPGDNVSRIITFEGGLRPEVFIADRASIHLQVGVSFAIVTGDSAGPFTEGIAFNIGQNAGLLAGAGLTVWLGGGPSSAGTSDEPPPPSGYGAPTEQQPAQQQQQPAQQQPAADPNAPPPDWESGDPGW